MFNCYGFLDLYRDINILLLREYVEQRRVLHFWYRFCALDVTRALWFSWYRYLPGVICSWKYFQSKVLFLLSFHFLPNGHKFMCPHPTPPFISITLEFCFLYNFLPSLSSFSGGIPTK